MKKAKIILIVLPLSLTACGHQPSRQEAPQIQEGIFTTLIMPSGVKKFNLHIPIAQQGGPRSGGGRGAPSAGGDKGPPPNGSGGGSGPRPDEAHGERDDRKQQLEAELEQRLQDKLYETQYCDDGYKLRDIYLGFSFQVITGECKDMASREDREKFPNEEGTEIR